MGFGGSSEPTDLPPDTKPALCPAPYPHIFGEQRCLVQGTEEVSTPPNHHLGTEPSAEPCQLERSRAAMCHIKGKAIGV